MVAFSMIVCRELNCRSANRTLAEPNHALQTRSVRLVELPHLRYELISGLEIQQKITSILR